MRVLGRIKPVLWFCHTKPLSPRFWRAAPRKFIMRDFIAREVGDQFCHLVAKFLWAVLIRWVWPERCTDHGATSRQRTPRPPDVKRRDMSMVDALLSACVFGDAFDGQINFDEAFWIAVHFIVYQHFKVMFVKSKGSINLCQQMWPIYGGSITLFSLFP